MKNKIRRDVRFPDLKASEEMDPAQQRSSPSGGEGEVDPQQEGCFKLPHAARPSPSPAPCSPAVGAHGMPPQVC